MLTIIIYCIFKFKRFFVIRKTLKTSINDLELDPIWRLNTYRTFQLVHYARKKAKGSYTPLFVLLDLHSNSVILMEKILTT